MLTLAATITHVVAGGQFTCVLLSTAAVQCFGQNDGGQLGSGATSAARETPGTVSGLSGTVVDVVAGTNHACGVMSTGQVRCWGKNDLGQLGIGSQSDVATATAIATLNVVPTTTTAAPTTAAPTTVAPTTVAPTTVVPSTTVEPTTTTSTTTTAAPVMVASAMAAPKAAPLVFPIAMRRGSKVSAAKLAASVSMSIPKRSVGTMRISITKGKQYCAFVGSSLKGIRTGKCTIVVILLPKRGKTVMRTNTLTVKK